MRRDGAAVREVAGVELMEVDHRLQARLLEALEAAVRQGRGADVGRGLLHDLVTSARSHFQTEDFLMRSCSDPELETHQREHDELLGQLLLLSGTHGSGARPITPDTIDAVRRLFADHAEQLDEPLARRLRG